MPREDATLTFVPRPGWQSLPSTCIDSTWLMHWLPLHLHMQALQTVRAQIECCCTLRSPPLTSGAQLARFKSTRRDLMYCVLHTKTMEFRVKSATFPKKISRGAPAPHPGLEAGGNLTTHAVPHIPVGPASGAEPPGGQLDVL